MYVEGIMKRRRRRRWRRRESTYVCYTGHGGYALLHVIFILFNFLLGCARAGSSSYLRSVGKRSRRWNEAELEGTKPRSRSFQGAVFINYKHLSPLHRVNPAIKRESCRLGVISALE